MAKRAPRLRNTSELSSFLARIIKEVYKEELSPSLGSRLAYMCNILRACLDKEVEDDILRRLDALEQQLNERENDERAPNLTTISQS